MEWLMLTVGVSYPSNPPFPPTHAPTRPLRIALNPRSKYYDPVSHPDVASGRMNADDAFDDLVSAMVYPPDSDGQTEVGFGALIRWGSAN